ncbi:MAG TPA: YebC/PmpR family DNA-binding transcriptional regulator [Candidatus Eremiobacteraceae bacterium]
MSGHSKWHNIRLHKGKIDAQRAQIFTKLSKEIIVAAKSGVPDPDANFKLKLAVAKARESNMPMDNIKRAIARATGEGKGDAFEEIRYEGFGPSGVAVIVDAVTDNRNRTASEMRYAFSRNGGNLGEIGCVAWLFEERGVIRFPSAAITEDQLLECADLDGLLDVAVNGEDVEIVTEPRSLSNVRDEVERRVLAPRGIRVQSATVELVPKTLAPVSAEDAPAVLRFLDALEEHEDVTRLSSNADIPDAVLEQLA